MCLRVSAWALDRTIHLLNASWKFGGIRVKVAFLKFLFCLLQVRTKPLSLWPTQSLTKLGTLRASAQVCLSIIQLSSRTPALWSTCQTSDQGRVSTFWKLTAVLYDVAQTFGIFLAFIVRDVKLSLFWCNCYNSLSSTSLIPSSIYHQTQCRGRVSSRPIASGTATPVSGLWPSARPPRQPALSPQTGAQLAPSMASLSQRVTATVPASHRTQVGTWMEWHLQPLACRYEKRLKNTV